MREILLFLVPTFAFALALGLALPRGHGLLAGAGIAASFVVAAIAAATTPDDDLFGADFAFAVFAATGLVLYCPVWWLGLWVGWLFGRADGYGALRRAR